MAKRSPVIIDSGFFIALGNAKDRFHPAAKKTLQKINDRLWITTWPVLTETAHFLGCRSQAEYQRLLMSLSQGLCEIFSLTADHLARISVLTKKYQDLPMDLADASLVILAEEREIGDIVSTDCRDFNSYRWKNRNPFKNILLTEET